jgi:6,7-dimethyl-8-ribityllumazine synthase
MKHMQKLGIVVSEFNTDITTKLRDAALRQCQSLGISREKMILIEVPGAVEIPLIAQKLCEKPEIDAVICLGAVVRGETGHYDYVCQQVSNGCQNVALSLGKPVIFGVLTTDNEAQALARVSKGAECVDVAVKMIRLCKDLA